MNLNPVPPVAALDRARRVNMPSQSRFSSTARRLLALALLLSLAGLSRADSISFTERLTEGLDCVRECEPDFGCETFCEERTSIAQSLSVSLTLPALRYVDLTYAGVFSLSIGNLSLFPDEISSASSNRIVFPSYQTDDETERRRKVGQVVLSKRGDVVTISASYSAPESAIVADQFTDGTGAETGDVNTGDLNFRVEIGSVSFERMIPFTARTTVTHKTRRVDDYFSEEYDFSSVQVSGSTNWNVPRIAITQPAPGLRWSNDVITVTGTATGSSDGAIIAVNVNGALDFTPVNITNGTWSFPAVLFPGANLIQAYCFDVDGSFSPSVIVEFRYVRTSPLALHIDPGTNAGTVLGPASGDLLEEGLAYVLTAQSAPNHLFEKWVIESPEFGTSQLLNPKLTVTHEAYLSVTAYFVTNQFQPVQGAYYGLLVPTNGTPLLPDFPGLGFVTLNLTANGRFSGKISAGRHSVRFSGAADVRLGTANVTINVRGLDPLLLYLDFNFDNGPLIQGGLTDQGGLDIPLIAYRVASPADTAPFAGKHTFLIPGAAVSNAAALPAGDGAGRITISAKGKLSASGTAGDGTAFSQSVPLCKDASNPEDPKIIWPFYASAKRGRELLGGFINGSPTNGSFSASPVHWFKQPNESDAYYPDGFDDAAFAASDDPKLLVAARYRPPGRGTNAVNWTEGVTLIDGGNLTSTISNQVSVALNKFTVTGGSSNQLTLKLATGTGLLDGSFLHPVTGRKTKFKGAILQLSSPEKTVGGGWFLGTSESGFISLTPAAP